MKRFQIYRQLDGSLLLRAAGEKDVRIFHSESDFSFDRLFCSDQPCDFLEDLFQKNTGDVSTIDPENEDQLLAPIESQEVWAAGVTYYRSRTARMEEAESAGGDIFYDKVYEAERPELFLKATSHRARGHGAQVGIRSDSSWDVPEPELTLAINRSGDVFGFTVGNDMSSRSIEGENPLYLPQAKVYTASCAIGPCLLVGEPLNSDTEIHLEIQREEKVVFKNEIAISQIKRDFTELAEFLYRSNEFPTGAYLMTGTGIVPDSDFTLAAGDLVSISIDGIGTLRNGVKLV